MELERALAARAQSGGPGTPSVRVLAKGDGWTVEDVICTSGPRDRAFEERHSRISVAIVVAGTFQYSRELMTPGSLLLGSAGQCFECRHDHGAGDRCISFGYTPEYFESLVATDRKFPVLRVPPIRASAPLVASAFSALSGAEFLNWEELSIKVAARAIQLAAGDSADRFSAPNAIARISSSVRDIEQDPSAGHSLTTLAAQARLSPYHFLRSFEQVTGVTPHQYILRARLRHVALRLRQPNRIVDIALDAGFGDLSNFNRTFRAEFGVTPRAFRAK